MSTACSPPIKHGGDRQRGGQCTSSWWKLQLVSSKWHAPLERRGQTRCDSRGKLPRSREEPLALAEASPRRSSQKGRSVALMARSAEKAPTGARRDRCRGPSHFRCRGTQPAKADVEGFIDATVEHFGRIDIVVNNAGGAKDLQPLDRTVGRGVGPRDEVEPLLDVLGDTPIVEAHGAPAVGTRDQHVVRRGQARQARA